MNILSRKVMVLAPYTLKVDGRPPFGNKGTKITPTYYPVCRPGQARLELNGTGTCTRLLGGGGGARLVPDLLTYSTAPGRVFPPPLFPVPSLAPKASGTPIMLQGPSIYLTLWTNERREPSATLFWLISVSVCGLPFGVTCCCDFFLLMLLFRVQLSDVMFFGVHTT